MDRRRVTLVVALVASLALVVGLSVSLLGGVGTSSTQTATTVPRQEFFGIAQGITRFNDKDLQTMAATGIGTDRFLLDWALVEPTQGSFTWPDHARSAPSPRTESGWCRTVWGSPPWVAATPPRPPLDSASDEQAWQDFLQAAVARYGPGGSYWAHDYHQQFGTAAKPLPIQSWQIWNEPNLEKYFAPKPSAEEYARLLEISHDVIKSQDPQARDRPRRNARLREAEGLGLPGQPLRDTRDQKQLRRRRPASLRSERRASSARRSRSSARR